MMSNKKKLEKTDSKGINTIIGEKTVIQGKLLAEETLRIDGTVKGEAISKGSVIIGEHSLVEGDVTAVDILVAGTVNGNLHIQEKTELTKTSCVNGDIRTKSLVIEEGATFQGNCSMEAADHTESSYNLKSEQQEV